MLTLQATPRKETGRKNKILREKGIVPAVVYGRDMKSVSIQVPYSAFEKIFHEVRESGLINLEIEGASPIKVLIYEVQFHPLTDKIQHIDFYKIKAGEKITVEVELKFIGQAPAQKELGGVMVPNLTKVEIECLPEDLIHEIEVDISKLTTFEDVIRVSDLKIPRGIKILQSPEEAVVAVEAPRTEEELKKLEEVSAEKIEEVKVEEKGKEKEEEEKGAEESPQKLGKNI